MARLAAVAWILLHSGLAQSALRISGEFDRLSLDGHWRLIDDPSQSLSFPAALTADAAGVFVPIPGSLGRGFTASASWLAADLANDTETPRFAIIQLAPQMLDFVDVYWQQGATPLSPDSYSHQAMGDHVPARLKPMALPYMGVPIEIPAGTIHRLYVRVQTTSSHQLRANLVSRSRYERDSVIELTWTTAYQAFALGIALITFLQAFRLRDLAHGLYGLVPLGLAINNMGTEAAILMISPNLGGATNDWVVGLSISLCFTGLSLFGMEIFQTRKFHPAWHWYLCLVMAMSIAGFLSSGSAWVGFFLMLTLGLGSCLWMFMIWCTRAMIARGETRSGWLIAIAFTLPLLAAAVNMFINLGLLPSAAPLQALLPATSLIHMVLMKLALTERLTEMESNYQGAMRQSALEAGHRQDKEKLIAMITHEIRTPLAVIDAATRSLQMLEDNETSERDIRYRRIERAVDRLSMLMDLAETHGLRDSEDMVSPSGPFDPLAATQSLIGLLDDEERGRITVATQGRLPKVAGIERMLRFGWLSLIDNACKYATNGSRIRIAISEAVQDGMQGIEWRIENDGPRIPDGMEERIFEKYWRGGEMANVPGLGLGLYLTRSIVERHGGQIRAEGGRSQGASFLCWLPLQPKAELTPR